LGFTQQQKEIQFQSIRKLARNVNSKLGYSLASRSAPLALVQQEKGMLKLREDSSLPPRLSAPEQDAIVKYSLNSEETTLMKLIG